MPPIFSLHDLPMALSELLCFLDLSRVVISCRSMLRDFELASRCLVAEQFSKVGLYGWRPFRAALLQQIREVLGPQPLLDLRWCARSIKCATLTAPMPVVIDTSGQFFVHFWMSVAKASNGSPCIGVVDADTAPRASEDWLDDLSRPRHGARGFGISCNPYSGMLHQHAIWPGESAKADTASQDRRQPRCKRAQLAWASGEGATLGRKRASVEIGVYISNGKLVFMRTGPKGWEPSGVVCQHLPAKVLCCAFLYDFVGEVTLCIEKGYTEKLPAMCNPIHESKDAKLAWLNWPLACKP
jgi:hypothetical protein